MLKHLLNSLGKKSRRPGAAAARAEDPRVAKVLAVYAASKARYAALREPARAAGASFDTLMDFAQACFDLELDAECEQAISRALALDPASVRAHYAMSLLTSCLARFDEAEAHLRQALARAPADLDVRLSLALVLLCRNSYTEGYELFRGRTASLPGSAPPVAALPAWAGEPLAGKTLVLWSDWGGLGDDLGYARFARSIRETHRPARLIVAVPRPLVRLLAAQPYVDEAVERSQQVDADFQCGLIEAARVLGTTFETLPSWPSYLEAPEADLRYWRANLQNERRLKVGLVWNSTSVPPVEAGGVGRADKHLPDHALAALRGVPGVVFVSLQKGAGIAKAADLLPGEAVIDDTEDLNDLADTAALILQLDLVITIDTSVAHLAGALGVPALVLLKIGLAHFWPQGRSDTPWYPSVRMIPQPRVREWGPVLARARAVLERRAAGVPWPACFDQHP